MLDSSAERIDSAFLTRASQCPDRTAVVVGTRRVSYAELDDRSNRLAAALRADGVGAGDLVGVCLGRDEYLIASILGVLRAGAGYVPLDPAYPERRLRLIAEDSGLRRVVTDSTFAGRATLTGATHTRIDEVPAADPVTSVGDPGDIAYVIYTSGSTGTPKGVMISHTNAMCLIRWALDAYTAEDLGGSLVSTSVCFDLSIAEIFPALIAGGTLIMSDNLLALPTLPARDQVTMIGGVPSVLAALARTPLPPTVRTITSAGGPISRALVDRLYANPGVRRVIGCYGPTETTTYCSGAVIDRSERGEPSIGDPFDSASYSIHGPDGAEVADGETGELWVAGPIVTLGYLNRPELTAERYVTRPDGQRAYRTGDLVRRVGGRYFCLGRSDDQVKIRGFRVELGEVATVLSTHPEVNQAVALAPADADDVRQLVGYAEPRDPAARPTEADLTSYLRERLPDYMVPARVLILDQIPLTPNGKPDRQALPVPAAIRPDTHLEAPRTDTERRVAAIIADIVGLPEVGVTDRFGDMGGHSLAAARVVARVSEEFGRMVPLATFLTDPTAAGLAAAVAAAPDSGPVLARHPGRVEYPLTDAQRDFWAIRRIAPDAAGIGTAFRLRITGLTDGSSLRAALDGVVERHEALRSVVEARPDGPVTVVRPPAPVPVEERDGRDLPEADRAALIEAALADASRYRFDVERDVPLIRAILVWTGKSDAEAVIHVDHIACDGWSIGVLTEDLAAGIDAAISGDPVRAPRPAVSLGDIGLYEAALRESPRDDLVEFWRSEMADATPPYDLPYRPGMPERSFRSARLTGDLPAEVVDAVRRFAAGAGLTPFAVYLAALGVVVAGMTGRTETVLGAVTTTRFRPGVERVVGPLVDVLPVRADLAGDPPFRALAAEVGAATLRALRHQGLPATELADVTGIERPRGQTMLPVTLSVQPDTIPLVVERGGIRIELGGEIGTSAAPNPLTVFINDTVDGPCPQLDYLVDWFTEADAASVLDRFVRVLRSAVADPGRPVSTLELMDEAERDAVLAAGTGAPAPEPDTVVRAILENADNAPDAIAVTSASGAITYAELADVSARVALALLDRDAETVGLCLPRDHLMPAAMLGVARAGATQAPLDPGHPADRLRHLVSDSGATLVIAAGDTLPVARAIPGVTVLDLADLRAGPAPAGDLPTIEPERVTHLIYTSGSTGRPKAVEITHANLAAFTQAMRVEPGLGPSDVVLAISPITFDVSGFDVWAALTAGARAHVIDRDTATDGHSLAAAIDAAGITVATLVPSVQRMLLAADWAGRPGLRVVSCGEPLDPTLATRMLERVDELWNMYGPTETTVLSTGQRISAVSGDLVPVGTPCAGERVYVLDPLGRLVPPGVTGEVWIGGVGVATGYRGRPDLTAAVFTDDPLVPGGRRYRSGDLGRWTADGALEILGRRDDQVKVRGYRVELGEVEAVLRGHPDVAEAAVTVAAGSADAHLVGYVVWRNPAGISALEAYARDRLPEYMVPRRWVVLDAIPTLTSGKVDRRALPDPEPVEHTGGDEPRSTMETFLAELWTEVLGVARVGAYDDFFALGGHSLAATRVVGRLRDALDCDLPVRALFDRPVLAEFATHVERVVMAGLAARIGART